MIGVLIRRRTSGHKHIQREDHVKNKEMVVIYRSRRETAEETNLVNTLI